MFSYTNPSVRTGLPPFNPPHQVFLDDAVHTEPFHPSTFELLYLMNCEHYDEELTMAINASNERNRAIYGSLVFLQGQRRQMMENIMRVDRHMGHDTDPDGDRFATDDDVNPNDPAFIRKAIAHRRSLKRATEVSRGQHLLQLKQRCIGAVSTPIPSSSLPQTHTTGRMNASTSRGSTTPMAGVSSLPADQRTLLYPDPFPITDDTRSDDSDVSDASRRAAKFPIVSPPMTLPAMSPSNELPSTPSGTTEPSRKTFNAARLSPELPNSLCLPSPIIPINPDTQRPYRVGVG
ncbi:hypothetical protein Moror_17010 [Moniliophthora roreri MCA 2997]|uniref:Uncharacterized protein n=1 Tax=Moniliophthora roreri (strain MCA 2997) TaxID=1381753 RepID=V2WRH6_MONRO|nr:hypothetical protein Moror_17010 [Moniliophthora roreri MCA 2997]